MKIESIEQRIAKQQAKALQEAEKLKQLKAQKQAALNRQRAKEKEQDRKNQTRRKILLGSYLLKKMENPANNEKILADLNEYLTEDRDRSLFGLPSKF